MPAPPMLADGGAWALEEMFGRPPDVVVSSAPYDVIANGQDQWWGPTQEFEGIAEDRWIKGYEFKPAYPNGLKVVHHGHASFRYGDGSGGFGGGVGIAHYGVGKRYETFPEGVGMLLPAGEAEVSWNIHYFPVGEVVENDVVDVGLWFYPEGERPEIETRGEVLYRVDRMNGMPRGGDILIPPYGEQVLQGIHVLSSPTLISSFRPHMHMRGKEMSMEAIYPDGRREMLGKVSDYRHIWQLSYQFEEDAKPLLPAGTMLLFTSVFDNSAENPLNPDPNQWVVFGRRGVDEMSHMWVGTTVLEQEEYDTMLARRQERHKSSRLRAAVANSLPPSLRRFKISFPARFHKWLPHCPWGKRCNPVCRGASRQLIPYFAVSQRPIAWSPDAGLRSHAPSRAWRAGVNPGPGAPQTMSALEPIAIANLRIAKSLYDLVQSEIAPGTGLDPDAVWTSLGLIVKELGPENRRLLYMRARHEKGLDAWHRERAGQPLDPVAYKKFLADAGYVLPEEGSLTITTDGVDPEISSIAGPQLVVPVDNARYALNAANARWGSLYDALYGTDVISEEDGAERGATYNPVRGARVVEWTERFLDDVVPLREGLYSEVTDFVVENYDGPSRLVCVLADDRRTAPADPSHFAGFQLEDGRVSSVLLCNHGLHIDIRIDRDHLVGKEHPAGVYDVVMESAITTIQDCEDSVSAVDAEDKTLVYRNWLGIMRGTLTTTFEKDGRALTRTLNEDLIYQDTSGKALRLSGRSLLLVRNVGIHMYTDAVTTAAGEPIPEGFLDALITSFCALHDLHGDGPIRNSRAGSIYIVKPKMHGPEEVGATVELFGRVEQALGMPKRTLKIGIMDEERRTTVNLKQCIRAAADRLIFINTGFLDRTGDEIHTSMAAGAMIPKPEIKSCAWMLAYEDWNVDVGIECGLPGVAQIGKGMWAAPDIMRAMVETKIGHPRAGANTAWVPSPTAATLHATHYHRVNVRDVQSELADRGRADLDAILALPLLGDRNLTEQEIQNELENNAQGILGYVVRWVGQGIGCSKVPDINDVALMEDRATLRISSQHIANWLHHGLVTADQVTSTFEAMAAVVDGQNQGDPHYRPMAPDLSSSPEFQAALELVFDGRKEPNGYTETVLHARRREVKARLMEQAQAAASEDQAAEGTQAAPETQGASEAQSAAQKAQPERETQGTQEARAR